MTTSGTGAGAEYFVKFQQGDFVFHEGDEGSSMYIIEDGAVDILKSADGDERKLASLEQGDFFGEMSVLDDQPREASARAASECQLLRIDKAMFGEMLRQNPEIAVRMLRKLARRLRNVIGSFEAPEPAPQRDPRSTMPAVAVASGRRTLCFVATGEEIVLPEKPEITVGRPDPVTGTNPDIDLTAHDTNRSVSRRHAKIYHRNNQFLVCEEIGTANGTFVNNERIKTGIPVALANNDVVSFGRVAMTYRES